MDSTHLHTLVREIMREGMQTMRLDVIANVMSQVTTNVAAKVTSVYVSVSKVERAIHFRAPCI